MRCSTTYWTAANSTWTCRCAFWTLGNAAAHAAALVLLTVLSNRLFMHLTAQPSRLLWYKLDMRFRTVSPLAVGHIDVSPVVFFCPSTGRAELLDSCGHVPAGMPRSSWQGLCDGGEGPDRGQGGISSRGFGTHTAGAGQQEGTQGVQS